MRYLTSLIVTLFISGTASAQISLDEAYRHLAEREAEHAASTRPVPRPSTVATTKPSAHRKVYKMSDAAPPEMVDWFNSLPDGKTAYIADLDRSIAIARLQLERVRSEPVQTVASSGGPLGGSVTVTDQNADYDKFVRVRDARAALGNLLRQRKRAEADPGPFKPVVGHLELKVGSFGRLGAVEIFQIEGPKDFLAKIGDETVWMTGWPTKDHVDGRLVRVDEVVHVKATKRYTTLLGGSNTVLVIEPWDYEKYLAAVDAP